MSSIPIKSKRKFINLSQVSRYLYCTICKDIFYDPRRIKCGHTFCKECIAKWGAKHNKCPICRSEFDVKNLQRDLIGFNMVNELEVYCDNSGCPWKGLLLNLREHLLNCSFDPSKIPDFIKEIICKDKKATSKDDENTSNSLVNFNTKVSLKARLYNKNKALMEKVFSKPKKEIKKESLFDILIN